MSERFHIVSDSAIEDTNRTHDDVWIRISGNFDAGEKQAYLTWLCETLNNTRTAAPADLVERATKLADKLETVWNKYCNEDADGSTLTPDKQGMDSQFHADLEDGWDIYNAMELLRALTQQPAPNAGFSRVECPGDGDYLAHQTAPSAELLNQGITFARMFLMDCDISTFGNGDHLKEEAEEFIQDCLSALSAGGGVITDAWIEENSFDAYDIEGGEPECIGSVISVSDLKQFLAQGEG